MITTSTKSIDDFVNDVENFQKVAMNKVNKVVKLVTIELFSNIINDTPVDTGQAQNNWVFSAGTTPTFKTVPPRKKRKNKNDTGFDISKGGDGNKSKVANQIKRAPAAIIKNNDANTYFMTNSVPYIRKLEYGGYSPNSTTGKTIGGFSSQAVGGMARKNIQLMTGLKITAISRTVKGRLG